MLVRTLTSTAIVLLALACGTVSAQDDAPAPEDPNAAVWNAAMAALQQGPRSVPLVDQAKLELPDGYGFIPREEAARAMEAMGNTIGPSFIGLILPLSDQQWFVTVDFEPSGYIKDDDAKDWDAEELLESIRDGTEEGNKHRADVGVPPIKVAGWIEKPSYDAASHQLVWSAEVRLRDQEDPNPTVNYNTYVLGREGYIALDLVTAVQTIEAEKPAAKALLSAVAFNEGKRYSDFDPSTDEVAGYGLAALVGGIAAKKLGLFALIGAFFVKFAKVIVIAVLALGGGIMKWLKGRSGDSEPQQSA
jgi:uncharacterized membrane-anchored protein